jgi:transposase-like protein
MTAHFLLTAAARTLTLASVARMSDERAERVFVRLRWSDNNGDAYCPHCGCLTVYACRRPNGAPRWRCKACRKDFSVNLRHTVCVPQDAAAGLPDGRCDLLQ